jgi:hypothetical protein
MLLSAVAALAFQQTTQFRPPAVPLVTSDPYISIWSEADQLTDDQTRHWTHMKQPLLGYVTVDDHTYRVIGKPKLGSFPSLPQKSLVVTPTRSIYTFANAQIQIKLTFMTPALPTDLDVYSRPVTYITWDVTPLDGHLHHVTISQDMSSAVAINDPSQVVSGGSVDWGDLVGGHVGADPQHLLRPAGDDTRIDWGYAYLVAPKPAAPTARVAGDTRDDATSRSLPYWRLEFDLGFIDRPMERHAMIGYDELYSIDYYGQPLRPYWKRHDESAADLFHAAERDYPRLKQECAKFDASLTKDAEKVGGKKYAQIVALAYRECVAANGLAADANGKPLLFTKEDTSNGDISTVDVIFPMEPIWLLLSPTLVKASLEPVFAYAASPHWKFPNAPHDLGTYPQVFGRDDGGEGMPVEESGNMILLVDALAHAEKSPEYANQWWPQLTQWAQYLEQYGVDPEDQLCTDDFMGHLAHNANLSVKAILALAAYGDLCRIRGDEAGAHRYADLARADAAHWVSVADASGHSLLAFDKPGTWSQKYNLVWDRLLHLNVFPASVASNEIAFYKTQLLPYGLPLDSRTHLTKTDWSIWSATMATDRSSFEQFVDPIYRYLNETTARDPIADSYVTDDVHSSGMHARPVVGGLFIRMLSDQGLWQAWAGRDRQQVSGWAPLPKPPTVHELVPTARTAKVVWRYETEGLHGGWNRPSFDDSSWQTGTAGFGTQGNP